MLQTLLIIIYIIKYHEKIIYIIKKIIIDNHQFKRSLMKELLGITKATKVLSRET